jgi:Rrf2 family protein
MAVNTQFSIAVHIMAGLGYKCGSDITSGHLAESVNTTPSFVRRVLAKLSKANLLETAKGKAGSCWLVRNPKDISLLEIYRAVGAPKVFAIHQYAPQKPCQISCNIKAALECVLSESQKAMEQKLGKITLADVISELKKC